jgi:flagellar hook-associated protein 3 FlgL
MRVGTLSQSDVMLQHMLRQQSDIVRIQEQVSTGKKYNDVAGFGTSVAHLTSSHSLLTQLEGHREANAALSGRLAVFDTGLRELENIGGELRDAIQGARGLGNGSGFRAEVEGLLERASSVLNTRFEGRFLFGGTNTSEAPVLVNSRAEILALAEPPAGDFFADSGSAPSVRLDERATLQVGVAASEVAGDLLHSMQRILMFDNGTLPAGTGAFAPAGSLDGQMSDNETAFLSNELAQVLQAVDTMQTAATENGLDMKAVEAVQNRLEEQTVSLTDLIANQEDVDLGEVATKLNNQQLSLEASIRMIAEMRSLSLLNVL